MSIAASLPPLELNIKTAGPLLRLLLAQRGLEDPDLEPDGAWDVFKLFCRLPAKTEVDLVSFQATWTPEDAEQAPDPPLFYCTWTRELTEADEFFSNTRAIQIQWSFDPQESGLDEFEAWSEDFPNLDAFIQQVESTPQFRALMASNGLADIYTFDLET